MRRNVIIVCVVLCALAVTAILIHRNDRRFNNELTAVSERLKSGEDRPSTEELNTWLDRNGNRQKIRGIASTERGSEGLAAWLVLLAARDKIAADTINKRIDEAEAERVAPWEEGGAYDYISVLSKAGTPEAKAVLWEIILRLNQRQELYRSATNWIGGTSDADDLPKLAQAVRMRIRSDPGYVGLAREVAEMITQTRFGATDDAGADSVFLAWLDQRYPAETPSTMPARAPSSVPGR